MNLLFVLDPNAARRAETIRRARANLDFIGRLSFGSWIAGNAEAIWAARASAPISTWESTESAALLLGIAVPDGELAPVSARAILERGDAGAATAYGGYHALIRVDARTSEVRARCDLLGFFPLYYATPGSDVVLIATSAEALTWHPAFRPSVDRHGFADLIVHGSPRDGRTLVAGARRLAVGAEVVWTSGSGARERESAGFPSICRAARAKPAMDRTTWLEHVDAAVDRSIRAQSGSFPLVWLATAGLDSRMVAAYLPGRAVRAVTMGERFDIEVTCARRLARHLGFEHDTRRVRADHIAAGATAAARWEHLASGFSFVHDWSIHEHIGGRAPLVVSGLANDVLTGRFLDRREWGRPSGEAFNYSFAHFSMAGMRMRLASELGLAAEARDVLAAARTAYERCDPSPPHRGLSFQTLGTIRHLMGGGAWQQSFGAWPVLPVLDRNVIELALRQPDELAQKRLGIIEIVRRRRPDLLTLPREHKGEFRTDPIATSLIRRVARPVLETERLARWLASRAGFDTRYVFRLYSFDYPGWSAVRALAEPGRGALSSLLDGRAVDRLVPRLPETIAPRGHAVGGLAAAKLLLGMMTWFAHHPTFGG